MRTKYLSRPGWRLISRTGAEEIRKFRHELLNGREQYQFVLENLKEVVFSTDTEGHWTFLNSAWTEITGFTVEESLGKVFLEYVHPEDRQMNFDLFKLLIERKKDCYRYEIRFMNKDGSIRWIEVWGRLTFDEMVNASGMAGTLNDITERKHAAEERQRLEERLKRSANMETLGTLAGGVAHDLNNVVGVIVGYTELLLNELDVSNPLRSRLAKILNGSEKAAAIVQDLLTLARRGVSGGKVLNLNKLIYDYQNSPEMEKLSSCHSAARIMLNLEPDLLNISGSSVHLGKALFNLIVNAVEAMPDGGDLTIKTSNQYLDKPVYGYDNTREGDYAVLSITDTGEGIPTADLQRIFEPFYTKKVMGRSGTGLGLAVVWGTVHDHQGYINVQSEEGKGSTFTLYFPVTREEISIDAASISISEYMGKGETILVVDDVREQRDLAAEMLKKLNYNVTSVSSGEEAIIFMKGHQIDLLILDMIMELGMDGLDTYKHVLKIRPKQKAIIVSGSSESERVNAAHKLGAGAYVKKPYVIEKLGLAVRKEIDRSAPVLPWPMTLEGDQDQH